MPPAVTTGVRTPEQNLTERAMGITQAQKQALVDNLQLEITERARKLRAQYALQAQGLRARLEMRVNRIPSALRKRNIQDLVNEHTAKAKPAPAPPVPVLQKPTVPRGKPAARQPPKRKSDEISTEDDKENVPAQKQSAPDLANPKKRTKTTTAVANSKATRTAARKAGPTGVLSPRSHNSRTYPQSPVKPSGLPQENAPPARAAAGKPATRAPSRQVKRGGPPSDGRTSEGSNTSAGTTVVTKPAPKKAPVPKKTAPARAVGAVKRTAARAVAAVPPVASGRTLRKRN